MYFTYVSVTVLWFLWGFDFVAVGLWKVYHQAVHKICMFSMYPTTVWYSSTALQVVVSNSRKRFRKPDVVYDIFITRRFSRKRSNYVRKGARFYEKCTKDHSLIHWFRNLFLWGRKQNQKLKNVTGKWVPLNEAWVTIKCKSWWVEKQLEKKEVLFWW